MVQSTTTSLSLQGTAAIFASGTSQLSNLFVNTNLGVATGTYSSLAKLTVGGSIAIPTNSLLYFDGGYSGNTAAIMFDGSAFRFTRASAVGLRINSANTVIGADAFGSAKLSVNGNGSFVAHFIRCQHQ